MYTMYAYGKRQLKICQVYFLIPSGLQTPLINQVIMRSAPPSHQTQQVIKTDDD